MRRVLLAVGLLLLGLAAPARADDGPWQWPLAGGPAVERGFAPPEHRYGTGHRGVDLAGAPGQQVLAAGGGTVGYAGLLAGRGVVTVVHGALRTTYEPVTAAVAAGSVVAAGEVLGTLEPGHLGCPVAACLHWGLRRGETYLDPLSLVGAGPVRLLPVPGALDGAPQAPAAPAAALLRPAPVPGAQPGPAEPAADAGPGFSLRAADAPMGAVAVAALVAGIALLHRPRPHPDDPAPAGEASAAGLPPDPAATGPPAELLDLDEARLRRRPAS